MLGVIFPGRLDDTPHQSVAACWQTVRFVSKIHLGADGGAPARQPTAGARGDAVTEGERQDGDVARELERALQLQKHSRGRVQVSGAVLVLRVGVRADSIRHLPSGLHVPQRMLAQVGSQAFRQVLRWRAIQGERGLPHRAAAPGSAGLPARTESVGGRCSHQGEAHWCH